MQNSERRRVILDRQKQRKQRNRLEESPLSWGERLRSPSWLLTNGVRLGFLLMILAVLVSVWSVTEAHLTEQFRADPVQTTGLVDPDAGDGALTPDNIEKRILELNLTLRDAELAVPPGDNPRPRPFVIYPGEAARFIAARLQSEGFVADADLMNLYLRVNNLERQIEAGNFMLAETMTIPEIAEALQQASFEEVLVTLPEGMRAEEIAERLDENFVISSDIFLSAVRQPQSLSILGDYDFLSALPAGAPLEGFLFPDTYRFPVNAALPEQVISIFLDNFEAKVGEAGLSGSGGLSGYDLIKLASIVEREAVQADERPIIADVYLNRLDGTCDAEVGGPYLQADPTVQYARGVVGNWWWKPQSIEEYSTVVSPYNTYLYPGLPPAAIANPGVSAIQSTANPADTVYCFFLATGDDGRHVFAQTLAEQEQNLAIYGYNP